MEQERFSKMLNEVVAKAQWTKVAVTSCLVTVDESDSLGDYKALQP